MDWRPSAQLRDLLTGAIAWDDAHPAIRSWAMLTIHGAANTILAAPKPRRRAMIDKLEFFIALARAEHFGRAADALRVGQPGPVVRVGDTRAAVGERFQLPAPEVTGSGLADGRGLGP